MILQLRMRFQKQTRIWPSTNKTQHNIYIYNVILFDQSNVSNFMIVDLGFCVIRCLNIWDFGPMAYMDCEFTTGPIQAIMVIWSDGMNFFN